MHKIKKRNGTMSKDKIRKDKILALLGLGLMIFGIVYASIIYNDVFYPVLQADAKLERAKSTNNLETVADYIQEALDLLKDNKENPKWIFPDDELNWDLIKSDLKDVISQCKEAEKNLTIGSDAYQEMLDTTFEVIEIIQEQIKDAGRWECTDPLSAFIFWGAGIGVTFLWIMAVIVNWRDY